MARSTFPRADLKGTVPAQAQADLFVVADPLDYLRHDLLDHYANGATPIYWPNLGPGWVVI